MPPIKLPPTTAPIHFVKGRGTGSNTASRYDQWTREFQTPDQPGLFS